LWCGLVVGLSLGLAACSGGSPATLSKPPTTAARWSTWSSRAGLTIRYPSQWHLTDFLGAPATVMFPLAHLSSQPLTGPCASRQTSVQLSTDCFDATWPVPTDGVLIEWLKAEVPGSIQYQVARGRRTSIDGHRAKISSTSYEDGGREITATIAASAKTDYTVMVMTARLGPRATSTVTHDVDRMLRSAVITD
jgi:hypothetical protein